MKRLFDHLDLRVTSLAEARPFYDVLLPSLGFPHYNDEGPGVFSYDAAREHPKPEFVAVIEDPGHVPNATRVAFWADTREEVDALAPVLQRCRARNVEGPMMNPEYSPRYYAVFFEDPCGNRFELCCRVADPE